MIKRLSAGVGYVQHGAESRSGQLGGSIRLSLLAIAFVLASTATAAPFAEERALIALPELWAAAAANTPTGRVEPAEIDHEAEIDARRSYWIPALDIIGFDFLLNRRNKHIEGSEYAVTGSSIRRNVRGRWVIDNDPFSVNQFLHPYQGSMYHGFARSAGSSYWQALGYTFAGSALWEIAGETTPPSKNDQIASGIAGTFLGEPLFRMANLVLGNDYLPPFWRGIAAAAISPSTGFNRLAFGDRFDTVFPSHDPVHYSRLQLGYSGTTQNDPGTSTKLKRNEAIADFYMDYGLPGKPGYTYKRPFDYFAFQTTVSGANGIENIMTRGLLVGRPYEVGGNYRGVWGLYGTYDYIAPQLFRVSSTALSVGTTAQWWLSPSIAVQGTGLLGAGYAAISTLHGSDERDYHYGIAPQATVSTRFIFGNRASLDLSAREFFVTRAASADRGGHDNIVRADASLTWRIQGKHAVALKYLFSRRDASFPDIGDRTQTRGTIGIFYTLLGHDRFGAVDWR